MLPPVRVRGGIVECSPGSSGAVPMTPRKGAIGTENPCWFEMAARVQGADRQTVARRDGGGGWCLVGERIDHAAGFGSERVVSHRLILSRACAAETHSETR